MSVLVQRLMRSPLVRYTLASWGREGRITMAVFVCFVFFVLFLEEGGKVGMRYLGGKEKMMVSQAADVSPLVWL